MDIAKELGDDAFKVFESTNLRMLEDGSWRESTNQPKTCHMQALRQVLTPTGVYNCPAHRGVDKAVVGPKEAYSGRENAETTGKAVAGLLDNFDASHECRNVTCLYHEVNWWIEGLVENPERVVQLSDENGDFFL